VDPEIVMAATTRIRERFLDRINRAVAAKVLP
jgi:hypothetical protein